MCSLQGEGVRSGFLQCSHPITPLELDNFSSSVPSFPLPHQTDYGAVILNHFSVQIFTHMQGGDCFYSTGCSLTWQFCSGTTLYHEVNVEITSGEKFQASKYNRSQFFLQLAHGNGSIIERSHFFVRDGEGSVMAHRSFIYMIALLRGIVPLPPHHQT